MYFLNKDDCVYESYGSPNNVKDSIRYPLVVAKDTSIYKKYLSYETYKKQLGGGDIISSILKPFTYANDTAAYYTKAYDYNIYRISPQNFDTAYKFVFPLFQSLPADWLTNTTLDNKRTNYLLNNKDIIFDISNFYKRYNNMLFKIGSYSSQIGRNFIYNTVSGNLFCMDKIIGDAMSYYLPITSTQFGDNGILNIVGDNIYTSFSSLAFFKQKEQTADKKPVYPSFLKKYFATASPKNNPIIVQLKIKKMKACHKYWIPSLYRSSIGNSFVVVHKLLNFFVFLIYFHRTIHTSEKINPSYSIKSAIFSGIKKLR